MMCDYDTMVSPVFNIVKGGGQKNDETSFGEETDTSLGLLLLFFFIIIFLLCLMSPIFGRKLHLSVMYLGQYQYTMY